MPSIEVLTAALPLRPLAAAFHPWATGLAASDPAEAVGRLTEAIERFRERDRPLSELECLLDLADAQDRAGTDGGGTRALASAIAQRTGALLFSGIAERG